MKKFKSIRHLIALVVVLALMLAIPAVIYAATGTVTVTGGTLSVTPANVTLSGVTLDGTDKTATSAYTSNAWTAQDSRGTGVGWNVTISSTDFTSPSTPARTIDISAEDQQFKIQLLDANISVIAGNTKPTSSVTSLTAIDNTTPLKIVSAAVDAGMGEYNIPPAFELEVPAETYVGTGTYTATITVTAVTAP